MRLYKRGMVVAGHAATADAGAAVLRAGGNAVDAAIAAVTTSFCAEPVLTSAGGGGFLLLTAPEQRPVLYDGFCSMPGCTATPLPRGQQPYGLASELKAVPIDFGDTVQNFHIGQAAVAAPSLLAMLFAAHRRHGRLPLQDALAPGIDAARSGIRLNALQASFIALLKPILSDTAGCQSLYAPHGALLIAGEDFCNRDLANTLEMLAIEGIDEMYHGDLARTIVRSCLPHGLLGMADMAAKQVERRVPLAMPLLGGTLLSNPPPSSGGLLMAYSAALLEQLSRMDTVQSLPVTVLLAEVLRSASRLRQSGLDARLHDALEPGEAVIAELLHADQLRQQADAIARRLQQGTGQGESHEPGNRLGSTTHISIVDKDGMAVSLTSSNGEGSGIVVPGTGIHLNNMLGEADINPLGFHALPAGTRLSSMMAPSILMQDGRAALVFGSGGSNRLRGAMLQVLIRHRLLGVSIEAAVHAARLHNEAERLDFEPDCLCDEDKALLIQQGWQLNPWRDQSVYFGGVHAISSDPHGKLSGAGDPRRGGVVCLA